MWSRFCAATLLLTTASGASAPSLGASASVTAAVSVEPAPGGEPLGVQTCDTQCQSDKTDCELACDQVVSCVEECQKVAAACVDKCKNAPPSEKPPAAPPKKPSPAKGAKPPKAKKP